MTFGMHDHDTCSTPILMVHCIKFFSYPENAPDSGVIHPNMKTRPEYVRDNDVLEVEDK
jgi:hypothetical protein